jgi:nicotinamidase-related amidase
MNDALLVMDVQNGIVESFVEHAEPFLSELAETIAAARASDVPVIYVRIAFRDGTPEVSPRSKTFAARAGSDAMSETSAATQVHDAVAPQAGDIVVMKKRVSAFIGSDLDVVLRSLDIDSLVLTGIATRGVVLSTLRQAADLDFGLTVLQDCCADGDAEVHRVLLDKVFPRQANVLSAAEWRATLR